MSAALNRMGYIKAQSMPAVSGGAGYDSWAPSGFTNLGSPTKQIKAYLGWISKAVNFISNDLAALPVKLYLPQGQSRNEWKEITDHPFLELIEKPTQNDFFTGREYRFWRAAHLLLTGMNFTLVLANALRRPAELWPLLPSELAKIESGTTNLDFIKGYKFNDKGGRQVLYPRDQVEYNRLPHPASLIYGASPVQTEAHAFDIDLALRTYQRSFMQNDVRPGTVWTNKKDGRLDDKDARRMELTIKKKLRGPDKAGEPIVLDGLEPHVLQLAVKDAEFGWLAGWTRDQLLACYGVSAAKLGLTKEFNRANMDAVDVTYRRECIGPYADKEAASLTRIARRYDPRLVVEFENVIPKDDEAIHKREMDRLEHGAIVINEWREGKGLEPRPWGDVPLLPVTMQPLSSLDIGDSGGARRLAAVPKLQKATADQASSLEFIALNEAWERPTRKALAGVFGKQAAEIKRKLKPLWPRVAAAYHGWSKAKVKAAIQKAPPFDPAFTEWEAWAAKLKSAVWDALIAPALNEAGQAALPQGDVFDIADPAVRDYLQEFGATAAKVNQFTRFRLQDVLARAIEDGATYDQAVEAVDKVFDWCQGPRAKTIARTEISNARRFGYDQGVRQSGIPYKKYWVNEPGARPSHAAAGRTYGRQAAIPLNDNFQVGAASGPLPGHTGSAREDINCRCHVIYLPDLEQDALTGPASAMAPTSRAYSLEEASHA